MIGKSLVTWLYLVLPWYELPTTYECCYYCNGFMFESRNKKKNSGLLFCIDWL